MIDSGIDEVDDNSSYSSCITQLSWLHCSDVLCSRCSTVLAVCSSTVRTDCTKVIDSGIDEGDDNSSYSSCVTQFHCSDMLCSVLLEVSSSTVRTE